MNFVPALQNIVVSQVTEDFKVELAFFAKTWIRPRDGTTPEACVQGRRLRATETSSARSANEQVRRLLRSLVEAVWPTPAGRLHDYNSAARWNELGRHPKDTG